VELVDDAAEPSDEDEAEQDEPGDGLSCSDSGDCCNIEVVFVVTK
jgi:hypothetical protein